MCPIILIRILRRNPEQLKTTNQDEATPPEDLKEVKEAPKEPIKAFEAIKKKTTKFQKRKREHRDVEKRQKPMVYRLMEINKMDAHKAYL